MRAFAGLRTYGRKRLALASVLIVSSCSSPPVATEATGITGVVRNAAGQAVPGALVKLRSTELGLGFIVVSQDGGRYHSPELLASSYTVRSFGGDRQSALGEPVVVAGGELQQVDLVLDLPRNVPPPEKRVTERDYEQRMPEGTGRELIYAKCTFCHGLDRIVPRPRVVPRQKDRAAWQRTLDSMGYYLEENGLPLSRQESQTILDYVSTHFSSEPARQQGPVPDPHRHFSANLLSGPEAKFVAMEFDLDPEIWVHDIAVDSGGHAWVTERGSGVIGRFDPESMTYSTLEPPAQEFPPALTTVAIDPEDKVWFTDNGPNALLWRYDPFEKSFKKWKIAPHPRLRLNINGLRFHPDGSVWGTGISSHRILRLDPLTESWKEYPVRMGSQPYGLAIGKEGRIWFSTHYGNSVGQLDPDSGELTEWVAPTAKADLRRMQTDFQGNAWIGGQNSGNLMQVDRLTGKFTEYEPPTPDSGPFFIDVDRTRDLIWFSQNHAGQLARFDPKTERFAEFPLPSADPFPKGEGGDQKVIWIGVDPSHPDRVWWAGGTIPRIGYVEVLE